jgi:hypothetical protein
VAGIVRVGRNKEAEEVLAGGFDGLFKLGDFLPGHLGEFGILVGRDELAVLGEVLLELSEADLLLEGLLDPAVLAGELLGAVRIAVEIRGGQGVLQLEEAGLELGEEGGEVHKSNLKFAIGNVQLRRREGSGSGF